MEGWRRYLRRSHQRYCQLPHTSRAGMERCGFGRNRANAISISGCRRNLAAIRQDAYRLAASKNFEGQAFQPSVFLWCLRRQRRICEQSLPGINPRPGRKCGEAASRASECVSHTVGGAAAVPRSSLPTSLTPWRRLERWQSRCRRDIRKTASAVP